LNNSENAAQLISLPGVHPVHYSLIQRIGSNGFFSIFNHGM